MSPRVSVVMAVKNYPDFLPDAMASILGQTERDIEFVIVDYGSTDGTIDIIKGNTDLRIRLIEWPGLTFTEALNVGVAVAKGKYIARQDADDYSLPTRLDVQATFLDVHRHIDVLGTGYKVVDPRSSTSRTESSELDHELLFALAKYDCPIAHGTLMVRSEVFDAFDYDEEMECAQDYGLYLKVMHSSIICHVIPNVLYIRFHAEGCVTELHRKKQLWCVAYAKVRYGRGHSWRHNRIRVHAEAYWRSEGARKVYEFIMVAMYDPHYWVVEYRKARAGRGVVEHN